MRTRIMIAGAAGLLVLGSVLYLAGWWIPNNPSPHDYPIRGLDVSRHQGTIDWKAVSGSGLRFVYQKATEGGDFQDASFKTNLEGAHAAGLACGAYHFYSLKTLGDVQARNFINTVPPATISLPPALDLEFSGNSSVRPPVDTVQSNLQLFVDTITTAYGREPLVYCASDFAAAYLSNFAPDQVWRRDVFFTPSRDASWLFWQFSQRGRVPGINGFVDLDVFHGPRDRFEALARNSATP